MDEKKQNLVELAKKKRYIALVEKLSKGALTSKELKELEQFEKQDENKEIAPLDGTVDLETISLYLEKTTRMVRHYIAQGMPVIRNAAGEIFRFKVSEVFKWYYDKYSFEDAEKDHWDLEYRKNKAKLSEIELKEKERQLIPYAEHLTILRNQVRGIRAGFLWLPRYIAPKLYQQEPKFICEILDNELRNIIKQFSGAAYAKESKRKNT
jgi:hypothetical protein